MKIHLNLKSFFTGFITLSLLAIISPLIHATTENFEVPVDEAPIDRDGQFTPNSYAAILKDATPAVVSVYTAKIVRVAQQGQRGLSPQEELFRRFYGLPSPRNRNTNPNREPEFEERKLPQGIGSGVIIREDGYIITNSHVVSDERGEDADEVLIRLNDGRELQATIVGRDAKTDVAILKVDTEEDLPTIQVANSDNTEVGDIVFAIGNPMGVGLTVTQGIISATGRSIGIYGNSGYESFIQTDASINPGNSGGALIDSRGRLIGINSAILSRTGGNVGIGFAIPSNLALIISKQLVDFGEVKRGLIGVTISDLTPDIAEVFGLKDRKGVLIDNVEEGMAADQAGIKRGDVILEIDGRPTETSNALRLLIGQTPPGTRMTFNLYRDGKPMELEVTIGDLEGGLLAMSDQIIEGVTVAPISDEQRRNYGIPQRVAGLVVTDIDNLSDANRFLTPGVVIMEINDQPVSDVNEARKLLRQGALNKLYVYDRGRPKYVALHL